MPNLVTRLVPLDLVDRPRMESVRIDSEVWNVARRILLDVFVFDSECKHAPQGFDSVIAGVRLVGLPIAQHSNRLAGDLRRFDLAEQLRRLWIDRLSQARRENPSADTLRRLIKLPKFRRPLVLLDKPGKRACGRMPWRGDIRKPVAGE